MFRTFLLTCFYVVCFIMVIAMKMDHVIALGSYNNPASDFRRHIIVQPTLFHARTKREISTTRHRKGLHHPEVMIKIILDNEEYTLDLRLNEDLIPEGHVISYQEDGKTVHHKPSMEELDICQYSGVVRDKLNSWAAVSTCHGVRGVIYDGQRMKHIEPAERGEISSNHFIYDHFDLNITHKCGFEAGAALTNNNNDVYDNLLQLKNTRPARHKREAFDSTDLLGPYNSNGWSRYVELVLVTDNGLYKALGEDVYNVHTTMTDVANIINAMYSPLNIFITLVGVVVWANQDKIQLSTNGDDTLNKFLEYRRTRLLNEIMNDNAQLITTQRFDEGVVGKAPQGAMCTFKSSGGIASYQLHSGAVIGELATTITHEMGHNFGMGHDDKELCKCRDKSCIMAPTIASGRLPVHWSSCSIRSLTRAFDRGADYCLRNKPKRLYPSPTCGNGFVERGEECDCGRLSTQSERNECHSCCDPRTCRFTRNAKCASGECCDLKTCRPKSAGTVCRPALKECDLPEYCTGHSEFCPRDVFKMDSTPCGKHQEAYCAGGSCKSHSVQCQMLYGPTAYNSQPKCYSFNKKGDKYGNCGYDWQNDKYKPCSSEDVFCGRLQCQRFEPLRFGYESYAALYTKFATGNGKLIQCHTADIDLGLSDVDPALVPDGAKCGDNKLCLKQRCVPVKDIRAKIAACPSDCNGRGICNSKGHCHCRRGFAPPECAVPGPGGSYDSGPATKPKDLRSADPTNAQPAPHYKWSDDITEPNDSNDAETVTDPSGQRKLVVAIYVIFLGILPLILLILFVTYFKQLKDFYYRNKSRIWRRNSNNSSFFTKFPRITIDASSHRIFFTYNSTLNRHANQSMDAELSEIHDKSVGRNVNNTNISQCQIPPVNILQIYDVENKNILSKKLVKKISREDVMNNGKRDPPTAALKENVTNDIGLTHTHPVRPKPPPKPKILIKENRPNVVVINKGLSKTTEEITVKDPDRVHR